MFGFHGFLRLILLWLGNEKLPADAKIHRVGKVMEKLPPRSNVSSAMNQTATGHACEACVTRDSKANNKCRAWREAS
jgi:hypothetical protein